MLREIDIKRSLYKNNDFMLSNDSLKNETINCEWESLDNGLYGMLKRGISNNINVVEQLRKGKIILGV